MNQGLVTVNTLNGEMTFLASAFLYAAKRVEQGAGSTIIVLKGSDEKLPTTDSVAEVAQKVEACHSKVEALSLSDIRIGDHFWALYSGQLVMMMETENGYYACGAWECAVNGDCLTPVARALRPAGYEHTTLYYTRS